MQPAFATNGNKHVCSHTVSGFLGGMLFFVCVKFSRPEDSADATSNLGQLITISTTNKHQQTPTNITNTTNATNATNATIFLSSLPSSLPYIAEPIIVEKPKFSRPSSVLSIVSSSCRLSGSSNAHDDKAPGPARLRARWWERVGGGGGGGVDLMPV